MTVLCFSAETTLKELHQFSADALYKEAIQLGLKITGSVHWTYFGVNADPDHRFWLEIALPVDRIEGNPEGAEFKQYKPFSYIGTVHYGPWETLGSAYPPLLNQIQREGHKLTSICREIYLFWDMSQPANNITEIQIGVD